MAGEDWAVVVGIKNYADPDLAGLQGPENDAQEFWDWVVSAAGGAVPKPQAKLILSSQYPPFTTVTNAMPTTDVIKGAFDHIRALADTNESRGLGRTVGRRLYLFFSGHGFAPSQHDDLAALLTAEASVADAKLTHIIGSYMADFFWRARYFEEILLFMDCCRSVMDCAQLYKPYEDERATDFYQVRRFYAYGARVAKESREWQMGDGRYHGVFTRTLVDALSKTGYDPMNASTITAESLRDQLYNGFKKFMSPPDQNRLDLPKEPEVIYEQKPGGNFTIVTRANLAQRILGLKMAPKYDVKLLVSPARIGKQATVRDKKLRAVGVETLANVTTLHLERGFYLVEVAGETEPIKFEVTGAGDEVHA